MRRSLAMYRVGFVLLFLGVAAVPETPAGCQKNFLVRRIGDLSVGPQSNDKLLEEKDVITKYGEGMYAKDEDHCGGRYYTDSEHTLTLHCLFGADTFLVGFELMRGYVLPSTSHTGNMESPALNKGLQIERGLKLGMRADELIEKLGKPVKDVEDGDVRRISYESDYEKDPRVGLDYEATYTFRRGMLEQIRLYDGE